jgi:hypothetical protein
VLRDFIESPMYPKREANRRRAADSGRIVGNPSLTGLLRVAVNRPKQQELPGGPTRVRGNVPGKV